jgi:hypothetical protein
MDRRGESPEQTTTACDITFAMLADPVGAVWSFTFFLLDAFVLNAMSCIAFPSSRYCKVSSYVIESLPILGNFTQDAFLRTLSLLSFHLLKSQVMIIYKSC